MVKLLLICIMLITSSSSVHAQVMDDSRHVDTLSIKQRISLKTNIVDWAAVVPNIGVEFDILNTNWNRWTAAINLRWRPKTHTTYAPVLQYGIFEVVLQGREYWRERRCDQYGYLQPHKTIWDKTWSCRNSNPSHPTWIFYRGGFLAYGQYSCILGQGRWGRQGDYAMAGVEWGFIKPFLGFRNGTSLDWEFGISAGYGITKSQRVKADYYDNCYVTDGKGMSKWHAMDYPMVRDIHVGLIYRMGNYPIQKKYRWRYDVDLAYHDRIDSLFAHREQLSYEKFQRDSIYKVVAKRYRAIYDSLIILDHIDEQAERDSKAVPRVNDSIGTNVEMDDSLLREKISRFEAKKKKKLSRKKKDEDAQEDDLTPSSDSAAPTDNSDTPAEQAGDDNAAPQADEQAPAQQEEQTPSMDDAKEDQEGGEEL